MAAGNQRKHLELTLARSKRLLIFILSVNLTWKHSRRHFSQHISYSELENLSRIDILVYVTRYPETRGGTPPQKG